MGRSQRHMIWEQGANAAGAIHDEGIVAPGIAMQVDPSEPAGTLKAGPASFNMGIEPKEDLPAVEIPVGPSGGPLQGSSLTGPVPEDYVPPEPGPDPEPPDPDTPAVSNLNPGSAQIGGADVTMTVTGTSFVDGSVITFNGGDEPTTFVSETELTTVVKPSTATVAGDFPVTVRNPNGNESAPINFVFTAAPEGEGGGRTFPIGPIAILSIRQDVPGTITFELESADVMAGDQFLVEATGVTAINGPYEAGEVNGSNVVASTDQELAAPIENKGRVTINGGA